MKVLFCKIHCPSLVCFCKPSSCIYKPRPLKLGNSPHVPPKVELDPEASVQLPSEPNEIKPVKPETGDEKQQQQQPPGLKSCLRSPNSNADATEEKQMKKVRWVDALGKELAEIREFECSEGEDIDTEGEDRRSCSCIIL